MDYDVGIVKQRRIISPSNAYFSVRAGTNVVFDAASTMQTVSSGTSLSWTHTPVGTPTAIVVVVFNFIGGPNGYPTAMTYGGTTMTRQVQVENPTAANASIWGLANPSSGAQTVAITLPAGSFCQAGSISVTGSDTVTCFTNSGSGAGTGTTASSTTASQTGDLVIDIIGTFSGSTSLTQGGSQTLIWSGALGGDRAATSREAGAASVTPTWTLGASADWCHACASVKHA